MEANGANGAAVATRIDAAAFEPVLESRGREEEILRAPADARMIALTLITVLLALFALRIAAAFLIPLLLSLFLSYTLSPVVAKLSRGGLPRPIGAAVAIALVIAVLAGAAIALATMRPMLQQIPEAGGCASRWRAQTRILGRTQHVQPCRDRLEALADGLHPQGHCRSNSRRTRVDRYPSLLLIGTGSAIIALGHGRFAFGTWQATCSGASLCARPVLRCRGAGRL
jgi:hypothetical protein